MKTGNASYSPSLLKQFRAELSEWIHPEELGRRCNLKADEVQKLLTDFRLQGYDIRSDQDRLRVAAEPIRLVPAEILLHSQTEIIGNEVLVFEECDSTNDQIWQWAGIPGKEGLVVFAEEQTRGRGRLGRRWFSPKFHNLTFSILLQPPLSVEKAAVLTLAAGVAITECLREEFEVSACLKWPNDVVVESRKIAGILVESKLIGKYPNFVVGIGLNVNISTSETPAQLKGKLTSMAMELERDYNRNFIAGRLLQSLDRWYRKLLYGQLDEIQARWRDLATDLDRWITLQSNGREYSGRILEINPLEGIILQMPDGYVKVFRAEHTTIIST
ncbi:biotin--[acetyl-CoA-carboxylase] ligase [Planctomycetota bacterium]